MQHEATTEKSKQCDNEIIDFKNAKQKALSRAVKAEEELQSTSKERDEAVQVRLPASFQQIEIKVTCWGPDGL